MLINILTRKLLSPDYPSPKGSRKNQFAPLPDGKAGIRVGVNELIFIQKLAKHRLFNLIFYSILTIVPLKTTGC